MTEGQRDENDFDHYFNATRRLQTVNGGLRDDIQRLQAELAARDAVIGQIRALREEVAQRCSRADRVLRDDATGDKQLASYDRATYMARADCWSACVEHLDCILSSLPSTGETE